MKAKPFTITDVGVLLGIQRLPGGDADSYHVVCPFCGDERGKCNFHVIKDGEIVNVYHCFHCGAGGNMLTLYADLNGIYGENRYQRAYWKIQEELPLGYQESKMRQKKTIERKKRSKELCVEPADYERRDVAYRKLAQLLKLSDAHKKDLKKRGLTEDEISRMEKIGYRSTCPRDSVAIARKLMKAGCKLEGVPGFFVNRSGDWEIAFYKKNSGYLCPVWSVDGRLIAFQIRLDIPYEKRKYVWLSSAKLKKGCSPGSPVSISGDDIRRVYVTEEKEVEVTSHEDITAESQTIKLVEVPEEPETPTPPSVETPPTPKTGDTTNLWAPIVILLAALAGIVAVVIRISRKRM